MTTVQLPGFGRLERLPFFHGAARQLNDALLTALREPAHTRLAMKLVADSALVIVAGGGQLDELWGGPWGHPFALHKWTRLARRAGVPVVYLSVGVCEVESVLARHFIRRALEGAGYRSYRDSNSQRRVRALGLPATDPIVPDLAYALQVPRPSRIAGADPQAIRVAISPMAYRDPRAWPTSDAVWFGRYLAMQAQVIEQMRARGWDVSMFATDGADWPVVHEILALLPPTTRSSIRLLESPSATGLVEQLGGEDLVVASRLHGLILSHLACRPTIALAYEPKVRTLMTDMEMNSECLSIDDATAAELLARADAMVPHLAELQAKVASHVSSNRGRVTRQYDTVLNGPLAARVR